MAMTGRLNTRGVRRSFSLAVTAMQIFNSTRYVRHMLLCDRPRWSGVRLTLYGSLGLTELENFFPDLVVLRKLFVVGDRQGINLLRPQFIGGLHFGMGRDATAKSHGLLSL